MKAKKFGSFTWRGPSIYMDYRINGKRYRVKFGTMRSGSAAESANLEREAQLRLNEIEIALRRGTLFDNQKHYPTYKQMALWYWEKHQSPKWYIGHYRCCEASDFSKLQFSIEYFGDTPGDEIKREHVKAFRMWLRDHGNSKKVRRQWSNAYINRIVATVGQVYNHCISQEIWRFESAPPAEQGRYGNIDICVDMINPILGLPRLPETPKDPIIPTIEQFRKLLAELNPIFGQMAIVGAHTGLRRRNIVELKVSEVDLLKNQIDIESQKSGAPLTSKLLHEEAATIIRERIAANALNGIQTKYVFCKPDGDCYHDFYTHWRKACEGAGLKGFCFEHLRPTYASWRFEEGATLPVVQLLLDHSTPTTTGRFYNRSTQVAAKVMEKQRSIVCVQNVTKEG